MRRFILFHILAFLSTWAIGQNLELDKQPIVICQFGLFTQLTDSTFTGPITTFNDQLGEGYSPLLMTPDWIILDGLRRFYTIDSLKNQGFNSADVWVKEVEDNDSPPIGVGTAYFPDPLDPSMVPIGPLNSEGIPPNYQSVLLISNIKKLLNRVGGEVTLQQLIDSVNTAKDTFFLGSQYVAIGNMLVSNDTIPDQFDTLNANFLRSYGRAEIDNFLKIGVDDFGSPINNVPFYVYTNNNNADGSFDFVPGDFTSLVMINKDTTLNTNDSVWVAALKGYGSDHTGGLKTIGIIGFKHNRRNLSNSMDNQYWGKFYLSLSDGNATTNDEIRNVIEALGQEFFNIQTDTFRVGNYDFDVRQDTTGRNGDVLTYEDGRIKLATPGAIGNEWQEEKYSGNPVITEANLTDPSATFNEAYPLAPLYWNADTLYGVVKNNGNLYLLYSLDDGENWTETSQKNLKTDWYSYIQEAYSMRKYQDSMYVFFYGAKLSPWASGVGVITATHPLATWNPPPAPFLDTNDSNIVALSNFYDVTLDYITIHDVKIIEDKFYYYVLLSNTVAGRAPDSLKSVFTLWSSDTIAQDLVFEKILFDNKDLGTLHEGRTITGMQSPGVIQPPGDSIYVMFFTAGSPNVAFTEQYVRQRQIYSAIGDTPFDFEILADSVINTYPAPGTVGDSWEKYRVYTGHWLQDTTAGGFAFEPKLVNGKYRYFYSGHSVAGTPGLGTGYTGIADFSSLPNFLKMTRISATNTTNKAFRAFQEAANSGGLSGLTPNYIQKAATSSTLDDSELYQDGSNIGLGTTNPQSKLDVLGGVSVGAYAGINAAPTNGAIISGNVGIGTNSPNSALDVASRAEFRQGLLFTEPVTINSNSFWLDSETSGAVNNTLSFWAAGVGSSTAADGPFFTMRGNSYSLSSQKGQVSLFAGNPSSPTGDDGSLKLGASSYFDVGTGVSYSSRLRITSGGDVLIKTTTDDAVNDFQLNGSARIDGDITLNEPGSATSNGIFVGSNTPGAVDNNLLITTAGKGSGSNVDGPQIIMRGNSYSSSSNQQGYVFFSTGNVASTAGRNGAMEVFADNYFDLSVGSSAIRVDNSRRVGIGTTSPTAVLHLKAGTATANTSPLKFSSGTNLTTPENGSVEFDGINYFGTSGGTRHTFAKTLTATASLDFGSTSAQNSADLTITVTGAADGDAVSLGVPNAAVNADSSFSAWVSAADTVTVRLNNYSSGAIDPVSGIFRVSVIKY